MAEIDYRLGDYQQNKSFAQVLANFTGGGGAGVPSDALVCRFSEDVTFPGWTHPGTNSWQVTGDYANLPWAIEQQSDAFTVEPDQDMTINKAGVYLFHLSLNPANDTTVSGYVAPNAPGNYKFNVYDFTFLDNWMVWPMAMNISGIALTHTWMGVYAAGDTLALPSIQAVNSPEPVEVFIGNYAVVRLAA